MIKRILSSSTGRVTTVTAMALLLCAQTASANKLNQSQQVERTAQAAATKSQKKIDGLFENKLDLFSEYKQVLQRIDSLRIYNQALQERIDSQEAEMVSYAAQIESIDETEKGVVPLMFEMIDTLGAFIDLDVPFLRPERESRVERLRENMKRADVSVAESYRQILEAYKIEMDYGNTISAEKGEVILSGGEAKAVDYLRVGRVMYAYQTLDGKMSYLWDSKQNDWVVLPEEYNSPIRQGIRIARRQAPKDLIRLPITKAIN